MKHFIIALFAVMSVSIFAQSSNAGVDPNEILNRKLLKVDDRFVPDESYDQLGEKERRELRQRTLEEIKEYVIRPEDCLHPCTLSYDGIRYFTSKGAGNIVRYYVVYYSVDPKSPYLIRLEYLLFADSDKAKVGARVKFAGAPESPQPYEINRSYTGKKFGDFCMRGKHYNYKTKSKFMWILYDRFVVRIELQSKNDDYIITPEFMDQWVTVVLNKIKKGLGEKIEE